MLELAEQEETLALFTEGIAGRYFHIAASAEFASHRRLALGSNGSGQTNDTLYLPEQLDAPDRGSYRVLVMEQLGLRECGTFNLRMATALAKVPSLSQRYTAPKGVSPRSGDYQLVFAAFAQPALAAELFNLLEQARVLAHLRSHYPGLQRHIHNYHQHLLRISPAASDPLATAQRHIWGAQHDLHAWQHLTSVLDRLQRGGCTVYDSVQGLCDLYDEVAASYTFTATTAYAPQEESIPDWLNREQRIEEWKEDLQGLEMAIAVEMLEADELQAERGDTSEAAVREADVDIKSLVDERDTMKRRIDMETSSVQTALGADRSNARSFRYDEWDYLQRRYLTHYCRVYEESLLATPPPLAKATSAATASSAAAQEEEQQVLDSLRRVISQFQPLVQKQLEQIRPTGLQRVTRVQDGDELDLNAIIEARQDIRAGHSPDERFYSRKERMHRDVCAIFLVDLSASTDDPIEPPQAKDWSSYHDQAHDQAHEQADGSSVNLRDPWDDAEDDVFLPDEPQRKIIDIQREAMVVMASSLHALGDSYGIYGFSGYGKDCVEMFIAKEPDQPFSQQTMHAIAAMKPKRSTRMGPAIRHSVHKLMQCGHAMKVLLVISDGFPQDADYGPERGNHDYGVADTAKALLEAQSKGVETFCVTVDRSGQDYLKHMCPDARYLVIEEMEDLPDQLSKVYASLTGR